MQERHPYKITPEQGWSHMQNLLDKSMPIPVRSRRFAIFWWTSAVGIVLIISSVVLMKGHSVVPVMQPITTAHSDMAGNEVPASAIAETPKVTTSISSKTTIINKKEETATINKKEENKNASQLFSNKKSTLSSPSNTKLKVVKSQNKMTSDKDTDVKSNISKTNYAVGSPSVISIENATKSNALSLESELVIASKAQDEDLISATIEVRNIRGDNSILQPSQLIDAFSYNMSEKNIGPILPGRYVSKNNVHPFHPTISTGMIVGNQNGLGINGNAGVEYSINSKFSLSGGVGLSTYRPEAFGNGKSVSLNSDELVGNDPGYSGTYIAGEKVNSTADYNAINPFVKSISQWELSAGLKYSFHKRFFIESGMKFGFGIKVKSEYPIVTFLSVVSVPVDINVAKSFNSYDVIRSTMLSVYGGIGFHLNRHIDLSAKWIQGLNHYLLNGQQSIVGLNTKRSDYIRGLNLGVQYGL
ncbi:MAG: hypothetical protein ABJC12_08600 [Saprospiraceae bacterium]